MSRINSYSVFIGTDGRMYRKIKYFVGAGWTPELLQVKNDSGQWVMAAWEN